MTDDSMILESVRIGAVPYLNAKPLVFGLQQDVLFKHPSILAEDFSAGRVDVALLPLRSVLEMENVMVADGISISSFGPVYSVFLAFRGALQDILRIHLDPASRSSANLLRVICRRLLKIEPDFSEAPATDGDARLLIGDQAIRFRREASPEWNILDLGEEWTKSTGLPFVYAVWTIRKDVLQAPRIAESLREIKKQGIAAIPEIIAQLPGKDREMADHYLTRCIRYDLGDAEKRGISSFADFLAEQGLLGTARPLYYV